MYLHPGRSAPPFSAVAPAASPTPVRTHYRAGRQRAKTSSHCNEGATSAQRRLQTLIVSPRPRARSVMLCACVSVCVVMYACTYEWYGRLNIYASVSVIMFASRYACTRMHRLACPQHRIHRRHPPKPPIHNPPSYHSRDSYAPADPAPSQAPSPPTLPAP